MKSIKFQHKTYTLKDLTSNIESVLFVANDDHKHWYTEAHQFARELAFRHNVPHISVCGIIASLSPLKRWEENKRITITFLAERRGHHTEQFISKAEAILDLEKPTIEDICNILNGNKITAFFLNIYNPRVSDAVTVDRHAMEIAVGQILTQHKLTTNQYMFMERAYQIVGAKHDLLPSEVQAITWEHWRVTKRKDEDEIEVPF